MHSYSSVCHLNLYAKCGVWCYWKDMEDVGGRSLGSLDVGVKRDAENIIMKIFLIRSIHRTLFGLSSCGCYLYGDVLRPRGN